MTGLSPRRRTDDGKRCDSRPRPLPSPQQGGNLSLYRDRKILMDLEGWSARLKVLADATRVRLLALLAGEELTVAELSAITQLAQPRVSTHLARLQEAGLVRARRSGVSAYAPFAHATLTPPHPTPSRAQAPP